MSLFGGMNSQARSRNLVEFKAGKMNLRGNMVYPDKRKGLVYLYQGNDMLMHLCWKDRSNSTPEDDLVIFPDEIEFKKVTQNTTGRVYILKWRSNARKLFFWMQESKDDKDDEYCKKINDLLNHPPAAGFGDDSGSGRGAHPLQPFMDQMASGGAGGIDPNDLSTVLRGMNPNDFASLISTFGGGGGGGSGGGASSLMQDAFPQGADSRPNTAPAGTRATVTANAPANRSAAGSSTRPRNAGTSSASANTPSNTASSAAAAAAAAAAASKSKATPIQMSALTSVLANLGNNPTQASGTATGSAKTTIDLYDIMTSENLVPLLSNKDVQDKLRPHLPEGVSGLATEKELRDSIQSPQFRQAVGAFSVALQSGELGPVLVQFNFPEDVIRAANQGDIQAFAKALEQHYKKSDDDSSDKKPSDNTMDTS